MLKNDYSKTIANSAITQKLKNFNKPVKFGPSKCLLYLHISWLGTNLTRFEKQIAY